MAELVRALLLSVHLVAGAVACGAPAAAAILALSRKQRERFGGLVGRLVLVGVAAQCVSAVVGGASLAAIMAIGDDAYLAAAARIPVRDYTMLASEWAFSLVLYGVMFWLARSGVRRPLLFAFVGLMSVSNLAYHFPTMMTVLSSEAGHATLAGDAPLDRAAYRERIVAPVMIARTLHYWSLCLTCGAVALGVASRKEQADPGGRSLIVTSAWGALTGLGLLVATGVATLTLLPAAPLRAMTGGDLIATAGTGAMVMITILVAHKLLPLALGVPNRFYPIRLAIVLSIAVLMMTFAASISRQADSAQKTARPTLLVGRAV